MKKVLLINTNRETRPYPVPPLGLCLVASALGPGYDVRVHDCAFSRAGASDAVRDFSPDFIGMGIRNVDDVNFTEPRYYIDEIIGQTIRPVREVSGSPIILGGSGYSLFPEEILALSGADYGVAGEGEAAFPELLRRLERKEDPAGIPGVVVKNGPAAGPRAVSPRLALPFAEIDRKIDFSPYLERGAYPVQTKRGCPHLCLYCTYPGIEGSACRLRDPGEVAREIREAYDRLGDITFEFVDSTFNDPPGHAEEICRRIRALGFRPRMRTMGINPANATPELFDLMADAGFAQIDCTPDSASPRVLARLEKNFSLAQLETAARLIRERDLPTMWFFIFGGPGENGDTFRETMDFIDRWIDPRDLVYMGLGLRIYPRTGLYELAIQEKIINPGISLLKPAFYLSPDLPREELLGLIRGAAAKRPNCVPVFEATPPADMLREAVETRRAEGLTEPMFRTLLRIRARRLGQDPSGKEKAL